MGNISLGSYDIDLSQILAIENTVFTPLKRGEEIIKFDDKVVLQKLNPLMELYVLKNNGFSNPEIERFEDCNALCEIMENINYDLLFDICLDYFCKKPDLMKYSGFL